MDICNISEDELFVFAVFPRTISKANDTAIPIQDEHQKFRLRVVVMVGRGAYTDNDDSFCYYEDTCIGDDKDVGGAALLRRCMATMRTMMATIRMRTTHDCQDLPASLFNLINVSGLHNIAPFN